MSNIQEIPPDEATGLLRRLFDQAVQRSGRVWGIVRVMSLNPPVLRSSMDFYRAVMFGYSPLSRWRREMLAVVTARAVDCFY